MSKLKVALIGNPNTGKTSLFNVLTGLNQRVGNYPGITVDKKTGSCKLSKDIKADIIDLPGTYSINTTSADEDVAISILSDTSNKNYPDVVVVVADVGSTPHPMRPLHCHIACTVTAAVIACLTALDGEGQRSHAGLKQ